MVPFKLKTAAAEVRRLVATPQGLGFADSLDRAYVAAIESQTGSVQTQQWLREAPTTRIRRILEKEFGLIAPKGASPRGRRFGGAPGGSAEWSRRT